MKNRGVSKAAVAGIVFVLAVLGVIVYSSLDLRRNRVEVCVEFQGRKACRIASGATKEAALRAATDNACAFIAAGMTDSMACGQTPPVSVRWLQ
jgi:hypothetical protein